MEAQSDSTYVTEIARLFPRQGQWKEQDYFNLPETSTIVELSDGELIVAPAPTSGHQKAVFELAYLLRQHIDAAKLGTVLVAPLSVRLREGKIREPDVLFFRAEHQSRIGEQFTEPPDWVAEVISPGTRSADEVDKLAEYAEAGIAEYWLVDPEARTIRVYALRGGSAYTLAATVAAGQVARSEMLPGFEVAVDGIV